MKKVFLVYGMIDISDYMNGEGDFLDTQDVVLAVCETKEDAEKIIEERKKQGWYDDYEIIEYEVG